MSISYEYVGQYCYHDWYSLNEKYENKIHFPHYLYAPPTEIIIYIYTGISILQMYANPHSTREVRTCSWSSGDIYIYHKYICNIDIHHPLKTYKCCQTHINRYRYILQKLYSFSAILLYLSTSHPILLKSGPPEKSHNWGQQLSGPKCMQLALNPNAFTELPFAFSAIK